MPKIDNMETINEDEVDINAELAHLNGGARAGAGGGDGSGDHPEQGEGSTANSDQSKYDFTNFLC